MSESPGHSQSPMDAKCEAVIGNFTRSVPGRLINIAHVARNFGGNAMLRHMRRAIERSLGEGGDCLIRTQRLQGRSLRTTFPRGVGIREQLDMVQVADLLARIDVNGRKLVD
jgi:hypothetical protein